jgi:hypothetical protein
LFRSRQAVRVRVCDSFVTALTASPIDTAAAPAPEAPSRARWTIDALFTPLSRALALAVLAVSFVFPVGGLGVDLCVFHSTTGLPCPGCGMTRALSALSQGDFSTAAALNPFAFVAWPTFAFIAALTFLGRDRRERLVARLNTARAGRYYLLAFISFLSFGLIRLAVFIALGERFP